MRERERDRARIEVDAGADTNTTTKMWTRKNKGKGKQATIEIRTWRRAPRKGDSRMGSTPPNPQPQREEIEAPDAG